MCMKASTAMSTGMSTGTSMLTVMLRVATMNTATAMTTITPAGASESSGQS